MSYSPSEMLLKRDRNLGGISALILGRKGSGKTTLLLRLAERLLHKDLVIWRGMYSCQFMRFPNKQRVRLFFLKEDYNKVNFYDMTTEKRVKIDKMYPVVVESNFSKLYKNMKKGYLNVLYLDRDNWYRFMEYLVFKRIDSKWISMFFDEFRDIAPAYPTKEEWPYIQQLDKIMRETRKMYISMYVALHNADEIFYAIKDKFEIKILLQGAKKPKGARIWQRTIDALKPGEAIVSGSGFEWLKFEPILKIPKIKAIFREKRKTKKRHARASTGKTKTKQQ